MSERKCIIARPRLYRCQRSVHRCPSMCASVRRRPAQRCGTDADEVEAWKKSNDLGRAAREGQGESRCPTTLRSGSRWASGATKYEVLRQGRDHVGGLLGKGLGRVSATRSSFVGLPTKLSFCRAAGKAPTCGELGWCRAASRTACRLVSASRHKMPCCRAAGKAPAGGSQAVVPGDFNGHPCVLLGKELGRVSAPRSLFVG